MTEIKNDLRKRLLRTRKELEESRVLEAGLRIQKRILALPAVQNAREALLYMPIRNEVRTQVVLEALWQQGTRVLLPRCSSEKFGRMHLACAECFEDLRPGKFNIPEPDPSTCLPVDSFAPDVALIPGVGFDRNGRRLGFGGGYYDRLLAHENMNRCLLVGLAYSFQLVDELPVEKWDKPVNMVVTENEIIEVPQ